jgi:hypothetical protein
MAVWLKRESSKCRALSSNPSTEKKLFEIVVDNISGAKVVLC